MAQVVAIGQPVNDSEREAIACLRDHLPNTFTVIHNFELKQGLEIHEIDVALLGPHCVHVIDVKGTRGHVDVDGARWYPERRAPYHSPLAILRRHAKVLKALIRDRHPTDQALGGLYVDAAVLMTAPDAFVQDPGGQDGPAVTYLRKCAAFFQSAARIPPGLSTDMRAHHRHVRQAIVGRAKPKSAPPCYGTWQVEERLGGTDRYKEYRAKHTLLGAKRGGTARLRVYPVDPYMPEEERRRERRRIENAYRAVAALPGHPNVLTVREFFPTEAEDRFVLVTADVAGHALRQHIRKSALALTFDQKIAVVRDVLAALGHAHRSEPQVVHRNLTPDAVLVAASGRALLCGFDHARAGRGGSSTTIARDIVDELDPTYQAPECDRDPSQASAASDLYAAGLVFYELLVGEPAWSSVDDMMDRDGVFPVKPSEQQPELPPAFDEWLQGLCAFDAEDRPSSAAVALARFNEIVGSDPRDGDGEARAGESAAAPAERPEANYATLQRDDVVADRFRIEELLGQGGFAVVYRVFDAFSNTSRVLKIIVKDRHSTFERLKREYSVLERLPPHPNVVRVVWADKLRDDTPYLVFEYVPGTAVNERLDDGSLSPEDVKRLGTDTLAGLDHLHRNGVFHRDVKPSNLLWTDRGVRIIDFNVAAHGDDDDEARPGGTRRYMPPDLAFTEEMTEAEKTDWDLFSLGVTLYECATGEYPWKGDTPAAAAAPAAAGNYARDLAPGFARVLMRAISPRRADRFPSAEAFRDALAAADGGARGTVTPAKHVRRNARGGVAGEAASVPGGTSGAPYGKQGRRPGTVRICIHRGTREIGGMCIEIEARGKRIVLDVGQPLDAPDERSHEALLPPVSGFQDADDSLLAVVISHPHLDHYGLARYVHQDVSVYLGKGAHNIMKAARPWMRNDYAFAESPHFIADRTPVRIGPFRITPHLVDHSAFDAYSLLVEADGKRMYYSGDFRAHGRKKALFDRMVADPPKDIDVLLMEGTTVGRAETGGQYPTEGDLEGKFVSAFGKTEGIHFVWTSSQNIDRLVTIFRAAKRTRRALVIDLYTAAILEATGRNTIPQSHWDGVKLYVPQQQRVFIKNNKLFDVLRRHARNRIYPEALPRLGGRAVMLFRPMAMYDRGVQAAIEGARFTYSMWQGYLKADSSQRVVQWLETNGIPWESIHTSGHASVADLQRFAEALAPRSLVPIHSFETGRFAEFFDNVDRKEDGAWWEVA